MKILEVGPKRGGRGVVKKVENENMSVDLVASICVKSVQLRGTAIPGKIAKKYTFDNSNDDTVIDRKSLNGDISLYT